MSASAPPARVRPKERDVVAIIAVALGVRDAGCVLGRGNDRKRGRFVVSPRRVA
jgi:hypothetical protein